MSNWDNPSSDPYADIKSAVKTMRMYEPATRASFTLKAPDIPPPVVKPRHWWNALDLLAWWRARKLVRQIVNSPDYYANLRKTTLYAVTNGIGYEKTREPKK